MTRLAIAGTTACAVTVSDDVSARQRFESRARRQLLGFRELAQKAGSSPKKMNWDAFSDDLFSWMQRYRGEAAQLRYPEVRACAADKERQEDRGVRAQRRLPQLHRRERA